MPTWAVIACAVLLPLAGTALLFAPLFIALHGYMDATRKLDEARHQARLARIRAGLEWRHLR